MVLTFSMAWKIGRRRVLSLRVAAFVAIGACVLFFSLIALGLHFNAKVRMHTSGSPGARPHGVHCPPQHAQQHARAELLHDKPPERSWPGGWKNLLPQYQADASIDADGAGQPEGGAAVWPSHGKGHGAEYFEQQLDKAQEHASVMWDALVKLRQGVRETAVAQDALGARARALLLTNNLTAAAASARLLGLGDSGGIGHHLMHADMSGEMRTHGHDMSGAISGAKPRVNVFIVCLSSQQESARAQRVRLM